jgi:hypothetical protein
VAVGVQPLQIQEQTVYQVCLLLLVVVVVVLRLLLEIILVDLVVTLQYLVLMAEQVAQVQLTPLVAAVVVVLA